MSSNTDSDDSMPTPPKTFMDLPREIYLMVCANLSQQDLTRLARVTKDCYLAVQEPLYGRINITNWDQLPQLVRTVTRAPVVSHISAKQRQRWHKLSDAQLRERDITKLNITLDTATTKRSVSGIDFARCIGAISRRSNGISITLTLYGPWDTLLAQLSSSLCTLPDVRRLVLCLGRKGRNFDHPGSSPKLDIWDVCFSGSCFPDLKEIEMDTLHNSPEQRPDTLKVAASELEARPPPLNRVYKDDGQSAGSSPFYGLKGMSKISVKYTDELSVRVLRGLFFSNIIPARLTHLEIVNCPMLSQVQDYADLAVLLERSLGLLQHFKLHLLGRDLSGGHWYPGYCSDIVEHPERHLCNVVRTLGQSIKSLDLALPYVCNRIFLPRTKDFAERDWPTIPREPYDTLRERLLSQGYRYRRLICWSGICGDGHVWDDMLDLVDNQGDRISWEIVSYRDKAASWHVSGCLPMTFKASDVLKRELPLAER